MTIGKITWRKSTYSGGDGGNCVELAYPGAVRDSKNPGGPVLTGDVARLITAVRAGEVTTRG